MLSKVAQLNAPLPCPAFTPRNDTTPGWKLQPGVVLVSTNSTPRLDYQIEAKPAGALKLKARAER